MKYQKPEILDIGVRMQRAEGQVAPNGCVAGPAAGIWESCGSGGSASWGCNTGGAAGAYTSCMPGAAASANGDCLTGSSVQYYCEVGASGGDDPYGCVAGPSFS